MNNEQQISKTKKKKKKSRTPHIVYGCFVGRNQWLPWNFPESGLSWENTGFIQALVLVLVKWEGKLEMSSSWWSLDPEVSYNIIWWCGFFLFSPPGRAWHMQRVIWSSVTLFSGQEHDRKCWQKVLVIFHLSLLTPPTTPCVSGS